LHGAGASCWAALIELGKPLFDRALNALQSAKRAPELEMPIFIPLDDQSKKNVGHDVAD